MSAKLDGKMIQGKYLRVTFYRISENVLWQALSYKQYMQEGVVAYEVC